MKVMQILPELNSGGVERGTLELASALTKNQFDSVVVSNGGKLVDQLLAQGSSHITLPVHRKSIFSLLQIKPLRQIILTQQPDIIHVRSRVPAWLTHFALRTIPPAQRPYLVSTVHGFYSTNRYSEIMTQADKVIAVSKSVVKYIEKNYPRCNPQHIELIYRGIDPDQFPYQFQPNGDWWQATYQQFPEVKAKFLLCLPGRISRLKGHETLLHVLQQLKSSYPQLHVVIVGGADKRKQSYLDELIQLCKKLGIEKNVTFTGHQSDIKQWLAAVDIVFSLSTQAETFGRTSLEALALGTPVIGWNQGGVGEILDEIYPYGAVNTNDTEALMAKIKQIYQSQPDMPRVDKFQLSQMTGKTIELYQRLLNKKRLNKK